MHVVTPTLDGDVLSVLAGAQAEFTGRQVHSLVGHSSPEGVRRALKRLVLEGVVDERQAGRANLYALNREHLAASSIEQLAHLRAQLLGRLRDEIAGWAVAPTVAALFGSVARGDSGPHSDLDLFFVRPAGADEDAWERQIATLATRATRWTGNDARPLDVAEEDLIGGLADEPVIAEIVDHGVFLAGSASWLRKAVAR
jgi:hypothetical protein